MDKLVPGVKGEMKLLVTADTAINFLAMKAFASFPRRT